MKNAIKLFFKYSHKYFLLWFLLAVTILSATDKIDRVDNITVKAVPVVSQLNFPWAVVPLATDEFLFSLKPGKMVYYFQGKKYFIEGVPRVAFVGQGGLLDLILSPNYLKDATIYFSFSEEYPNGQYGTSIAKARLELTREKKRLLDVQIIYRAGASGWGSFHFGSRLIFDKSGYLYITLGDRGDKSQSQNINTPYGSLLRLNPDGTIPKDNPMKDLRGISPIWTYGHRNAQGIILHPITEEIWIHEHGPKGGDELNIIKRGANYGWPITTHGLAYSGAVISRYQYASGIQDSVVYWVPSIAPCGMSFYNGDKIPEWKGNLFLGALKSRHLRRLILKGNKVIEQQEIFEKNIGRVRDVRTGPDGYLYILIDSANANLYRVKKSIFLIFSSSIESLFRKLATTSRCAWIF